MLFCFSGFVHYFEHMKSCWIAYTSDSLRNLVTQFEKCGRFQAPFGSHK
jgi:hypothetical protein